ncbi:MAG: hydrolase [Candidatus Rokuibacteriota bacterium]|nr:MAG: hydrolase [Candidatus Rokubacteria bacterium]
MNGRVRRNAQRLRPSDDAATPAPAAPTRRSWARATIGLIALALTVGACSVLAGVVAQVLDYRAAEFDVAIERGVAVVTSDGVRLRSDVFLPKGAARIPTILVRVPLDKTTTNTAFATTVGRLWAERGYAVVIQGTRGHYGSGGRAVPFLDERADGIETLRWIERQPWYDGRIGMWGGSYFGYTQWVVADQVEPGPAALFIQLCSTDLHRMFYPGGAFSLETALYWALRSRGDRDDPPSVAMLERAAAGFPLRAADDRAVEDVPAFNVWVDHPERDAYWAAVDGESRPERLRAPVLLMAGWYDPFLPTQLEDFVRIRAGAPRHVAEASRLIVGPWAHAETVTLPAHGTPRNYRLESLAPSLPWFDRHLRPSAPRAGNDQAVTLYVMGDNVWRDEAEWPLARARATPYYLRSGGRANGAGGDGVLAPAPATSAEPPDRYLYDPRDPVPSAGGAMLGPRAGIASQRAVERRDDVLVYTSATLAADVEVTGPVTLVLYVSTAAAHTDFTGKLVDVHPDGSPYNVSDGIVRRAYAPRSGPTEIRLELWPTSMVFKRGHRIRLEVSSSNYPRFDRNPNTGRPIATETEPVAAHQAIHHGGDTPSRLILPIVPRAARAG